MAYKKSYKLHSMLLILVLLALTLTGCSVPGTRYASTDEEDGVTQVVLTTGFSKDEICRIGKSSCTVSEFLVYYINTANFYASVYGEEIFAVTVDGTSLQSRIAETVLESMAKIKVMNLLAEDYNITLTDREEEKIKEAAEEYVATLSATELNAMDGDLDLITQLYREKYIASRVYDEIIADINPEISDDEARIVTVEWMFFASAIEDSTIYQQAKELLTRINAGENFDTLALSYSQDATITHSFGKGEVDSLLEEAAFNLAVGEVSEILKTSDGYYILKCISTFDEEETAANKVKIISERKNEAFYAVYDSYATEQIRQLNDKVWEELDLSVDETVTTMSFFDIYDRYFAD